jgi:hypothetical protein
LPSLALLLAYAKVLVKPCEKIEPYLRLLLVELVVMEFRLRQYAVMTVYLVQELKFFWGGSIG